MNSDPKKRTNLTEHAFPHVTKALLKELEDRFPARYPGLEWKDREIWYRAGQRSVVDFLADLFNEQVERSKS
jgi:hypothetical protein